MITQGVGKLILALLGRSAGSRGRLPHRLFVEILRRTRQRSRELRHHAGIREKLKGNN